MLRISLNEGSAYVAEKEEIRPDMQSRIAQAFIFQLINSIFGIFLSSLIFISTPVCAVDPAPKVSPTAIPAEREVSIRLNSIETKKTSEQSGDELYLDITQYSSLGQSKTDRIPKAPLHWSSSDLSQVADLIVWSGNLKAQEEIKVIFSLVEQDFPPWDLDELIGSCQVVITNHNGKIEAKWGVPVFEERVETSMAKQADPQIFVMKGDNSEYNIAFSVKTTDKSS